MPDPRPNSNPDVRIVGRYALYGKLATGGMATVHFGRLLGPVGFSRTVAIKRLHPQYAKDPEFVTMFLDEARLAARIQHPNVVATLDVVALGEELLLVMDYIRGDAFSRILRAARKKGLEPPLTFIATIVSGMLHGLHAAHEATDERGQPLKVVHRDVSPQNVLVGVDGVPRLLDFGVAKAGSRAQVTRDGQIKGKLSYMSPEQLTGRPVDRRADVFAAAVVLWEALTGKRLFLADDPQEMIRRILDQPVPPPSQIRAGIPPGFDRVVARGLEKDPDARYSTAREFAVALEHGVDLMSAREVGEWVEEIVGDVLELREQALAELESFSSVTELSPPSGPQALELPMLLRSSGPPRPFAPRPSGMFVRANSRNAPDEQKAESSRPPSEPSVTAVAVPHASNTIRVQVAPAPDDDPFGSKRLQRRTWLGLGVGALGLVLFWGFWPKSPKQPAVVAPQQVEGAPLSSGTPPQSAITAESMRSSAAGDGPPSSGTSPTREARDEGEPSERVSSAPDRAGARPASPARVRPAVIRRSASPSAATTPTESPPATDKARGCEQPWKVDSRGIRRIKTECL